MNITGGHMGALTVMIVMLATPHWRHCGVDDRRVTTTPREVTQRVRRIQAGYFYSLGYANF